jgi:thiaminase (transcriptional activator TenA)
VTFSDELRSAAAKTWDAATTHRFVDELWAGRVEPSVLGGHLLQEGLVLDRRVALMGAAVVTADLPDSRLALARRIGLVAGPPASYLARAMDVQDVPLDARSHPDPDPAAVDLRDLLDTTVRTGGYPELLAVLLAGDWLQRDCATRADADPPTEALLREWVELRRGAAVEAWVAFLRRELDRTAAVLDAGRRDALAALSTRAVELELGLLDAAFR